MCFVHLDEYEAPILWKPVNNKLQSFYPFPKLPVELRRQIWLLVPDARVVEVVNSSHRQNIEIFYCVPESINKPSALLQVNHESRSEYKTRWKPLYHQPRSEHSPTLDPPVPIAYFNSEIDTLFLGRELVGRQDTPSRCLPVLNTIECLQNLRYLAVEAIVWNNFSRDDTVRHPIYAKLWKHPYIYFPKLEQLIVAIGDETFDFYAHEHRRHPGPIAFWDVFEGNKAAAPWAEYARKDGRTTFHSDVDGPWTVKIITRADAGGFQKSHWEWATLEFSRAADQ